MSKSKRYFKYINTLFVVTPMSLIMAFVGITHNHGFSDGWAYKFFNAWIVMLPVAFVAAFVIIPPARKLAEKVTVKADGFPYDKSRFSKKNILRYFLH